MQPDAIVFDLWFTLITPEDHRRPYVGTSRSIPVVLGIDPEPFLTFWKKCLPEQHRQPRLGRDYITDYMASLGRTMSEQEYEAFDAVWSYHDQALASPRPDVLESIRDLNNSGIGLGLLSNAHEREIRMWTSSPLAQYFDGACFSCHVGYVKPEPEAYAAILDRLGISAAQSVFVGDGASSELEGARTAGFGKAILMRGLIAESGVEPNVILSLASQADAVIDRISDLRSLLDRPEEES